MAEAILVAMVIPAKDRLLALHLRVRGYGCSSFQRCGNPRPAGRYALDVFQGDDSRFLHHVSQVTGQGKLALSSLAQRGFDKENLAAHRGPCKSCYYSCIIVALIDVAGEWGGAENLLQV